MLVLFILSLSDREFGRLWKWTSNERQRTQSKGNVLFREKEVVLLWWMVTVIQLLYMWKNIGSPRLPACIARPTTAGSLLCFFVILVSDSNIFFYVVGAMAHRGDLITCEVDFDNQRNSSIPILFSLNGKEVAHTLMEYTAGQTKLYPFISLGYEGIRVLAKVCEISYGFLFGRNLRTDENLALRTFRSKTQPSFYNCKIFSRACWLSFIDKKWNL